MPESYKGTEARISEACDAYRCRNKPKIMALSREFDVPYYRLRRRVMGRGSRSARPSPNRALKGAQEQELIQWIALLNDSSGLPTTTMVEQHANGSPRTVSKMWTFRFIKRLPPPLNLIKPSPRDRRRLAAENPRTIQQDDDAPPPSSSTTLTPNDIQKLRRSIKKAQRTLQELSEQLETISPHLNPRLERILQDSLDRSDR